MSYGYQWNKEFRGWPDDETQELFPTMNEGFGPLRESRRNEATYRAIAQCFPNAAIYVFDRDLRYQVVEGEALADFGQNREEMEGKTLWETLDPETAQRLEPRYRRALAGESLHFETQYGEQHANRVIASDYRPIRDEAGEVVAGLLVARNITGEKRAQEEIRRANAELEATLSAIPAGLITYDAEGRITRMNALAREMLGYREDTWKLAVGERVGLAVQAFYPDHTPYEHDDYPAVRAVRGETVHNEDVFLHLPESPERDFWTAISAGPILGSDGQLAGTVLTMTDTTRLHAVSEQLAEREASLFEANRQLQKQADELREAARKLDERVRERTEELQRSREQTRLYARKLVEEVENERRNIARELHDEAGQSLTTMLMGLGMIEHEAVRSAAHLVEPIRELKKATNDVMEGLHRLSRNLRPASLDRLGLVAALRQHIQSFQQQTGIDAGFIPINLDNGYERLPGQIETAIYRVVQEALTNVARHARAQQAGVIVKRRARRVLTIIEDNGRGFDVVEAMQRGRLGLTGMRERAELMGGRLTIESAIGKGSTVFLDLPLAAESGEDEREDSALN